jgi:hypothetical protein
MKEESTDIFTKVYVHPEMGSISTHFESRCKINKPYLLRKISH